MAAFSSVEVPSFQLTSLRVKLTIGLASTGANILNPHRWWERKKRSVLECTASPNDQGVDSAQCSIASVSLYFLNVGD